MDPNQSPDDISGRRACAGLLAIVLILIVAAYFLKPLIDQ
jgi:hypothetical protein